MWWVRSFVSVNKFCTSNTITTFETMSKNERWTQTQLLLWFWTVLWTNPFQESDGNSLQCLIRPVSPFWNGDTGKWDRGSQLPNNAGVPELASPCEDTKLNTPSLYYLTPSPYEGAKFNNFFLHLLTSSLYYPSNFLQNIWSTKQPTSWSNDLTRCYVLRLRTFFFRPIGEGSVNERRGHQLLVTKSAWDRDNRTWSREHFEIQSTEQKSYCGGHKSCKALPCPSTLIVREHQRVIKIFFLSTLLKTNGTTSSCGATWPASWSTTYL